jgi:hypothetical protein
MLEEILHALSNLCTSLQHLPNSYELNITRPLINRANLAIGGCGALCPSFLTV